MACRRLNPDFKVGDGVDDATAELAVDGACSFAAVLFECPGRKVEQPGGLGGTHEARPIAIGFLLHRKPPSQPPRNGRIGCDNGEDRRARRSDKVSDILRVSPSSRQGGGIAGNRRVEWSGLFGIRLDKAAIAVLDQVLCCFEETVKPAAFRRILPVDGAQLSERRVQKHARDLLSGCALADAVPGAQHQAEAVDAIRREVLPAWPSAGGLRR